MKFGFSFRVACCDRRHHHLRVRLVLRWMIHNKRVKNLLWIWMRFSLLASTPCSDGCYRTKVKCASLKNPFLLFASHSYIYPSNKFTHAMFRSDTISILWITERSKHWEVEDVDEEKKGSFTTKLFKSNYRNRRKMYREKERVGESGSERYEEKRVKECVKCK